MRLDVLHGDVMTEDGLGPDWGCDSVTRDWLPMIVTKPEVQSPSG